MNRVCVNPQSLCDDVLRQIGRSHTAEDFFRAFDVARESGIPYINTDLIVGLPGDSFRTFSKTFDQIVSLRPENITVHTFCVKKASEILRQDADVYSLHGGDAGKCVDYTQLQAQQEGYKPYYMYRQKNTVGNYENVGFALEGAECRYNIYMMEEVHTIFAAGAGAVTKMVDYGGRQAEDRTAVLSEVPLRIPARRKHCGKARRNRNVLPRARTGLKTLGRCPKPCSNPS